MRRPCSWSRPSRPGPRGSASWVRKPAKCSLWRRGFKRAEAARAAHPTPDHDEIRLDLLFVAGSTSADRAALSIANTASGLKPGGALVVDLAAMPAGAEGEALIARLAPLGFSERPALLPHMQILADKVGEPDLG